MAALDRELNRRRAGADLNAWLALKQRTKERVVNAPEVAAAAALALAEIRSLPPAA